MMNTTGNPSKQERALKTWLQQDQTSQVTQPSSDNKSRITVQSKGSRVSTLSRSEL